MLALMFRYGMLLMLGMSAGGILSGQFAFGETLIGIAFIVLVVGGLAMLIKKYFGIAYPKFLNTKTKQRIADLVVFLLGIMVLFGTV